MVGEVIVRALTGFGVDAGLSLGKLVSYRESSLHRYLGRCTHDCSGCSSIPDLPLSNTLLCIDECKNSGASSINCSSGWMVGFEYVLLSQNFRSSKR
jgi:hypothetical protein